MNVLDQTQADFVARARASAKFASTAIVPLDTSKTEDQIDALLGSLKGHNGKIGTALFVSKPTLVVRDPDAPGPRTQILQSLTVVESRELNFASTGSRIPAEQLALDALQLFHHFTASGIRGTFVGSGSINAPAIAPADFDRLAGFVLTFAALLDLDAPAKAATPLIDPDSGAAPQAVTLEAAPGAAIYTTRDGSYPSATNPAATLYSAPLAIAAACTLRAVAYADGQQASNVAEALYT